MAVLGWAWLFGWQGYPLTFSHAQAVNGACVCCWAEMAFSGGAATPLYHHHRKGTASCRPLPETRLLPPPAFLEQAGRRGWWAGGQ